MSAPGICCLHLARLLVLAAVVVVSPNARAAEDDRSPKRLERELAAFSTEPWIRSAIGVTRQGTVIPCFLTGDDLDPETEKSRILVIGGLGFFKFRLT